MSKTTYFIIGAVIIGGAAYIFRDKLFPSSGPASLPDSPESEAADFGLRGAFAGAVDAALGGLDVGTATLHAPTIDARIMTAPAPRLTLAALTGAATRRTTAA